MTAILQSREVVALSGADAQQALCAIYRDAGRVSVSPAGADATPSGAYGVVWRLGDDSLVIRLSRVGSGRGGRGQSPVDWETAKGVRVQFRLEDQDYWFEGDIIGTESQTGATMLRIKSPAQVSTARRRRFWRADVRRSTPVTLCWGSDNAATGELLNLSPGGLACRVGAGSIEGMGQGAVIRATFTLEGAGGAKSTGGKVQALTPAGEADQVILRIEFDTPISVS